jgi:hypothetical protein
MKILLDNLIHSHRKLGESLQRIQNIVLTAQLAAIQIRNPDGSDSPALKNVRD